MKNDFCDLHEDILNMLPPSKYKGLLLSPFQHNIRGGFVMVPSEEFKLMIDMIADVAVSKGG